MIFYREHDFREAPSIGRIPKDWGTSSIEEIAHPKKGAIKIGPFGSQIKKSEMAPKGIKIYGQENVIAYDFGIGSRYISREKFETLKNFKINPGDVLITMMGSLGYAAIFPNNAQKGIMDSHLLRIQLKKEIALSAYLLELIKSPLVERQIRSLSRGAIMSGLNSKTIRSIKIPLPSLPEQEAIVKVLGVVDSAIMLTNRVIAKIERLKKGLTQQLLTQGIGHTEYKNTSIGKIPKEWVAVTLGDVCDQRKEIIYPSEYDTYTFVGLEHINSSETKVHTYVQTASIKSSKFRFNPEDILYGKLRPYLDKAVLVDFSGICSTDLLVLKTKKDVSKEFLVYVIHSRDFLEHAIATTSGTNHPRTSWKAISGFKFGLPKMAEQQRIAETLSAIDRKLEVEKLEKTKLERIKRGLMDLLLTGKLRVKVD